jgi:hypothetical protein
MHSRHSGLAIRGFELPIIVGFACFFLNTACHRIHAPDDSWLSITDMTPQTSMWDQDLVLIKWVQRYVPGHPILRRAAKLQWTPKVDLKYSKGTIATHCGMEQSAIST